LTSLEKGLEISKEWYVANKILKPSVNS
jgi:hypothetical protein